jgi:hypothetical protein
MRKWTKPDTASMSLREVLEYRRLRTLFTQQYAENLLAFNRVTDLKASCDCCGDHPTKYWSDTEYRNVDVPLDLLRWASYSLCRDCFQAYWCNTPQANLNTGCGTPHSAIPGSQQKYEGGNFHGGEW